MLKKCTTMAMHTCNSVRGWIAGRVFEQLVPFQGVEIHGCLVQFSCQKQYSVSFAVVLLLSTYSLQILARLFKTFHHSFLCVFSVCALDGHHCLTSKLWRNTSRSTAAIKNWIFKRVQELVMARRAEDRDIRPNALSCNTEQLPTLYHVMKKLLHWT